MADLKSCPFCGNEVGINESEDIQPDGAPNYGFTFIPIYQVVCLNNDCILNSTNCYDNTDEIIKLWNKRNG